MRGFVEFIREKGVVGLAIGIILGGAVSKLVASFVNDLISPVIGIIIGAAGNLKEAYFKVGPAKFMWGSFVSSLIDFLIIAVVVYFGVKVLRLDQLDKKKG